MADKSCQGSTGAPSHRIFPVVAKLGNALEPEVDSTNKIAVLGPAVMASLHPALSTMVSCSVHGGINRLWEDIDASSGSTSFTGSVGGCYRDGDRICRLSWVGHHRAFRDRYLRSEEQG